MTDWSAIGAKALDAVKGVLAGAWDRASGAAAAQIAAMTQIAAQLEIAYAQNPASLSAADYHSLRSAQKNALEGILSAYEGIGILAAEQAADAAWAVIAAALKSSIPFA